MRADLLDLTQPLLWTVPDVLSVAECQALIARIDAAGPVAAPITTAAGFVMRPDIRNNTRVIIDDVALAAELYRRVLPHLPARMLGMTVVGANERLRCYRYAPGQRFAPHYDGAYFRSDTERSLLTFLVYLNEGFTGGDTAFLDFHESIRPKTGRALLFQHAILHEGCAVEAGVKYAVRSDIMYRTVS